MIINFRVRAKLTRIIILLKKKKHANSCQANPVMF